MKLQIIVNGPEIGLMHKQKDYSCMTRPWTSERWLVSPELVPVTIIIHSPLSRYENRK